MNGNLSNHATPNMAVSSPTPIPKLKDSRSSSLPTPSFILISLLQLHDQSLFKRVLNNEVHVLQQLLPDKTMNCYKLRPRKQDRQ